MTQLPGAEPAGRLSTIRAAYAAVGNHGPGFDTIRLLAASAVVLHHSLKIEHDIVRDDWIYGFSHGYTQLGLLSVAVFFALSGYLVTPGVARNGDVIEYLSRRFMRIMPLLAAVVFVTALVIGPLFSALPPLEYYSSPQTWHYLKSVTTALSLQLPGVTDYDGGNTINGPMWTLRHEWTCYFLVAGASLTGLLRWRWAFLALWIASQALMLVHYGPLGAEAERPAGFLLLYLFGYFGAGALMYLYGDILPWSRPLVGAAGIALLAAWGLDMSWLIAPALTAYLVVGLGLFRFPWNPLLEKADLSYGVYLTHSVVLMMLMNMIDFTSSLALFATCLPLTYLVALATWTFIEKPALARKSLPAQLAKGAIARLRGGSARAAEL